MKEKEMKNYESPELEAVEIKLDCSIAKSSQCPLEAEGFDCLTNEPPCEND